MRQRWTRHLVVGLGLAAGAMTIAGGGNSLALTDNTPTFAEQSFIALQGRVPKTWPDIKMDCVQGGSSVFHQKKSSQGGGAYFTFGPTSNWTSGSAVCTAALVTYDRKGNPRIQDELSFTVKG
jgi:hypothetical protein